MALREDQGILIRPKEPPSGDNTKVLNVPRQLQRQSAWCWAACAAMILRYHHNSTRMCQIVRFFREEIRNQPVPNCCVAQDEPVCDRTTCKVDEVKPIYNHYKIFPRFGLGRLTEAQLQSQITREHPVQIGIQWSDRAPQASVARHAIIVRGWIRSSSTGKLSFKVNDPWGRYLPGAGPGPSGIVVHQDLVEAYGLGTWFCTWMRLG